MGVVMSQFWGGRLRIWGLLRGSIRPVCEDMWVVMSYGGCYVAVLGREAEDMGVVMWQFCGGRLMIWGLFCGNFKPRCEEMGVVMSQFLGERLKIWWLLCGSFGAGG